MNKTILNLTNEGLIKMKNKAIQLRTYTFEELTPLAQQEALSFCNNGEIEGKRFFESGALVVDFSNYIYMEG